MRRPLAALASDALRPGLRLLGGLTASMHQIVATETAREIARSGSRHLLHKPWTEDCWQNASTQFIH